MEGEDIYGKTKGFWSVGRLVVGIIFLICTIKTKRRID